MRTTATYTSAEVLRPIARAKRDTFCTNSVYAAQVFRKGLPACYASATNRELDTLDC